MLAVALLVSACAQRVSQTSGPVSQPLGTGVSFESALKAGDVNGSIEVDGRKRTFILHLPSGFNGKSQLPLVIVFHGGGQNASNTPRMTGMSTKADRENFIAVYPNGSGQQSDERFFTWNSGNCCTYAMKNNIDDVKFIDNLIDGLSAMLPVDPARVYATGISNGGMMSYLVGCRLSSKIAAIAPVAGAMGMETCNPSSPVSVIIFHGTDDEYVLYNGGISLKQVDRPLRTDKPVSYAVDFWVRNNGCSETPLKETTGNVIKDTYSGGKNGTAVVLYTILDGKHAWPGGLSAWLGGDEPTTQIYATDLMWQFFKEHPKAND